MKRKARKEVGSSKIQAGKSVCIYTGSRIRGRKKTVAVGQNIYTHAKYVDHMTHIAAYTYILRLYIQFTSQMLMKSILNQTNRDRYSHLPAPESSHPSIYFFVYLRLPSVIFLVFFCSSIHFFPRIGHPQTELFTALVCFYSCKSSSHKSSKGLFSLATITATFSSYLLSSRGFGIHGLSQGGKGLIPFEACGFFFVFSLGKSAKITMEKEGGFLWFLVVFSYVCSCSIFGLVDLKFVLHILCSSFSKISIQFFSSF